MVSIHIENTRPVIVIEGFTAMDMKEGTREVLEIPMLNYRCILVDS